MELLCKGQLWLMQQVRIMIGVLWDFVLVPAVKDVIKAMEFAAGEYGKKVKQQGKGHTLGSPHVHVAQAMVEELSVIKPEGENEEEAIKLLKQLDAHFQEKGMTAVGELITYCRSKLAYHDPEQQGEAMCKVSFKLEALAIVELEGKQVAVSNVRGAIIMMLKKVGGKQAQGSPPRGELERLVQQQLHGLQGRG